MPSASRALIVEHVGRRVPLGQIQPAPGFEEMGDHLGPAPHVRQPAERTPCHVDEIEGIARRRWRRARRRHRHDEARPRLPGPARLPAAGPHRRRATEKSSPTTSAPRCASVRVSVPKWHCRCSTRRPSTGPSSASSMALSRPRPVAQRAADRRPPQRMWIGTRSSQLARLRVRQSFVSSAVGRARRPPSALSAGVAAHLDLEARRLQACPPSRSGASRSRVSMTSSSSAPLAGRSEKMRWW